jgi:uncharacterized protein (DUF1778 family)
MPTPSITRTDRIELRASREQKRVLAAAEEIIAGNERITLSPRDSLRVLDLLEHPPKPTAALRAAAKRRH